MALTYAGVKLSVPSPEVSAWITHNINPAEVYEFVYPYSLRQHTNNPGLTPQRPLYVSRLYWPTDASRWSIGHFLATDTQLDLIRLQVVGAGGEPRSRPLVIGDGRFTLTADLFILPARPLTQIAGSRQLYLLTLVDERYYWWFKRGDITVTENTTTWAQLYAQVASLLGITLTVDPVAAAYLKPSDLIAGTYDHLPPLLDQIAHAVGQRIVRQLDGSVRAMNATTSRDIQATNIATIGTTGNLWRKQAGGVFTL